MLRYDLVGEGEIILFLHGALVSSAMWKHQIEYFLNQYRVLTVDLPEHGGSREIIAQPFTVKTITNSVLETLSHLNVRKFHLCGHSLGGMVAQEIVFAQPEAVKSLILAESSYGTRNTVAETLATVLSQITMLLMSHNQLVDISRATYGQCNPETKEYIVAEMSSYDIKQCRRVMSAAMNYSSKARLSDIAVRTLILVGEENKQTHKQASTMHELIGNSRLVTVPNAHHLLNMDNPSDFNEQVEDFLRFRSHGDA